MPRTIVMPRGKRPPRAAAANSSAINNTLLGKRNIGQPSLQIYQGLVARQIDLCPSGGIGVKNMDRFRKRNRDIKIKKVLPQSKIVQVKKTGVVVRTMTVRRKTYFPGRRKKVY